MVIMPTRRRCKIRCLRRMALRLRCRPVGHTGLPNNLLYLRSGGATGTSARRRGCAELECGPCLSEFRRGQAVPSPERLRSKPVAENQLHQAGNPIGIKLFIADLVLAVFFSGISAPVRTRAIDVGESVLASEAPRTENASALFFHLGVGRQSYDGPANVSRRF